MDHFLPFTLIIPSTVIGLSLFIIGMRLIITRQPFLIPNRWMLYMMTLSFLPIGLSSFFFSKLTYSSTTWFLLFLTILLIYMATLTRGYSVFGITTISSLREALLHVLKKMNIAYEETLGSIKMPSVSAELQVFRGCQIIIKPNNANSLLDDIAKATNTYFQENNTRTSAIISILYFIFSVFMIVPIFYLLPILNLQSQLESPRNGIIKSYYGSGAAQYAYQYVHGELEGVTKEYFPNGKLEREWLYHNGHLNGITKEYYPSGGLRYEYTYVDDKPDGISKGYSEDGKLIWERTY